MSYYSMAKKQSNERQIPCKLIAFIHIHISINKLTYLKRLDKSFKNGSFNLYFEASSKIYRAA